MTHDNTESQAPPRDTPEVHPEDRFTWERIVMRARLDGVITGRGKRNEETGRLTRGGVSGALFKVVALVFAAHADEDGSNIRPGDMRVAILAEVHPQTVKAVRDKLIALGLLTQTGRYRHTPMYRLTLPADLTELIEVLTPADVVDTAKAMRAKLRDAKATARNGYATGSPKQEATGTPPAYPNPPEDPPDAPKTEYGYAGGTDMGTPVDNRYQPLTGQQQMTNHNTAGVDLRTTVTHPTTRAQPQTPNHASPPPRCEHGLTTATRADGRPACALCRITAARSLTVTEPEDPTPLATVTDIRTWEAS
jgi:hypothetical protein